MSTAVQGDPFVQQLPRSSLRHRPIQSETSKGEVSILKPRASQVSGPPTNTVPVASTLPRRRWSRKWGELKGSWVVYIVVGMLIAMVLLWLGQLLWSGVTVVSDDLHYGRPRTTNVDQFVGHETGNTPSHFIAVNLNGQIYVIEIPGGSTNTSHLLVGPHLIGPGSDLAPVSLSFPGDPHHPDLLVTVGGIQVRFHNTGDSYVATSS